MGWFSPPQKIDPNKVYGMMHSDYEDQIADRSADMIDPNSQLMQGMYTSMKEQGQDSLYTQYRMNRMNMASSGMGGQSGIQNSMADQAAQATSGNLSNAYKDMLNQNLSGSNQMLNQAGAMDMQGRDAMASAYGQNVTNLNNYNAAMAGNVMQGLGAGAQMMMMCDARMKKNIKKVGKIKMKNGKSTGLYEFSYKSSKKNKKHLGVMAQDVEKNNPKAVTKGKNGLKYVYPKEVFG